MLIPKQMISWNIKNSIVNSGEPSASYYLLQTVSQAAVAALDTEGSPSTAADYKSDTMKVDLAKGQQTE